MPVDSVNLGSPKYSLGIVKVDFYTLLSAYKKISFHLISFIQSNYEAINFFSSRLYRGAPVLTLYIFISVYTFNNVADLKS